MKEPWEMTKEEWGELLRKRLTEEEAVKYFPRKNIYDEYRIYHKRYGVGEESFIVPTYKFLKAPKSGTFEINQYILQSNPDFIETLRRWHIEQALKEGKPVPPEVLKDYPDLAEKYGKAVREEDERTLKEEILNIIRTHKRLEEATPLFRELSEKYGLELYKILAELVRENKLKGGITKAGRFRYWELPEEEEEKKEEKKEAKPKEEAIVEKLAELIEEKERLAKERAKEERKPLKPRKRKIHIPEEIREEIESVCKEAVEERLREILGRIGAELKGAEKLECLCISCQRPIEGEYRVLGCEVYCIYCARGLEKEKKERGESVSWNPENKCICAGCGRAVSTFRCSGGICYCLSCAGKVAGELVFDDERGPVEREIREAVREALLYYLGS